MRAVRYCGVPARKLFVGNRKAQTSLYREEPDLKPEQLPFHGA
jgi:hypothetical protein